MKISEVIKRLEELKEQHGDLPVKSCGAVGYENYEEDVMNIELDYTHYDHDPIIALR